MPPETTWLAANASVLYRSTTRGVDVLWVNWKRLGGSGPVMEAAREVLLAWIDQGFNHCSMSAYSSWSAPIAMTNKCHATLMWGAPLAGRAPGGQCRANHAGASENAAY